jgi:hypothetical protein
MRREEVLSLLAQFRDRRAKEFGITRIGIFGSLARGEATDASDVDVVVELERPDLLLLVGIKQELEELLQRSVYVVQYRERMNPFLTNRILRDAVYV